MQGRVDLRVTLGDFASAVEEWLFALEERMC